MTDPAEASAKPVHNLRGAVLGTAGILLALALAWFVGAVAVPFYTTRAAVRDYHFALPNELVRDLGGPGRAEARLRFFVRLPRGVVNDRDRDAAADVLGHLLKWEQACELYRTTPYAVVKFGLSHRVFSPLRDDPAKYRGLTMNDAIKLFGNPECIRAGVAEYGGGRVLLEFDEEGRFRDALWIEGN